MVFDLNALVDLAFDFYNFFFGEEVTLVVDVHGRVGLSLTLIAHELLDYGVLLKQA